MEKIFLIVSPPYNEKSGGVMCLHELCDALIKNGYESHILLLDGATGNLIYSNDRQFFSENLQNSNVYLPFESQRTFLDNIIKNGIVIYPEIIVGNPLGAERVVRYFLNADGLVTGIKSGYQAGDFCLAFSKMYFEDPHDVLFRPFVHEAFSCVSSLPWNQRIMDVTYIGKGANYENCVRINNSLEINRDYPHSKEELSIVLKSTRYFYSWDVVSSTNIDAIMCGARLVLMQDRPFTRDYLRKLDHELGEMPFLLGRLEGGIVAVEDRPDYDVVAHKYIENIQDSLKNWSAAVGATARKIVNFFEN